MTAYAIAQLPFADRVAYAPLHECRFEPLHYAVSPRYRCGTEVIEKKRRPSRARNPWLALPMDLS